MKKALGNADAKCFLLCFFVLSLKRKDQRNFKQNIFRL